MRYTVVARTHGNGNTVQMIEDFNNMCLWHRTSINRKYKSSTHRHNILEPIQYLRQMNSVSCTDNEFMPLWSKFSHSPSSKLWTGWSKSSHRPTTKAVGSFRDWGCEAKHIDITYSQTASTRTLHYSRLRSASWLRWSSYGLITRGGGGGVFLQEFRVNALPDAYVRPTPTRCLGVVFPPLRRYYDIFARVSDSSGENLTPACQKT